ncbi:MAG: NADH:ubiquinone oxidoreductase [Patescibacteria group bacterium]
MNKPKIGIFDLTDCEGCELQMLNLKDRLLRLAEIVDIPIWRLAKTPTEFGPFDVSFVEGTPMSADDIRVAKKVRENSKTVVALGACAHLGGVPAELDEAKRNIFMKEVYGKNYKTTSKPAKPLSAYIQVDHFIHGCPIDLDEAERVIVSLLMDKNPSLPSTPVCLECKERENPCLFLKGEPCQGPITEGGCKAICPSNGLRCWGCQGPVKNANFKAMEKNLERLKYKDQTENIMDAFSKQVGEKK